MEPSCPTVSIGLPVYNGEKYLRQAIESVLAQTYQDFELVIFDNASTDRTPEICLEYRKKDPRVRYHRHDRNLGAAANYSALVPAARGRYFKWIAADSAIEPEFLGKCVQVLEAEPDIMLVCTNFIGRLEEEDRTLLYEKNLDLRSDKLHERFRGLLERIIAANGNLPLYGLMRKEGVLKTRLLRALIGADDFLTLELGLVGKFRHLQDHLLLTRRHPGSYTDQKKTNFDIEGIREVQFFDPAKGGRVFFPHWRRLWEYWRIAMRSGATPPGKLRMSARVLILGFRWRRKLAKEVFFALGLGRIYIALRNARRRLRRLAVHGAGS